VASDLAFVLRATAFAADDRHRTSYHEDLDETDAFQRFYQETKKGIRHETISTSEDFNADGYPSCCLENSSSSEPVDASDAPPNAEAFRGSYTGQ
jgi:hypothetical protein